MPFPLPTIEPDSSNTLPVLNLPGDEPGQAFEDLARLAAQICQAPSAVLGLFDAGGRWLAAQIGLDESAVPSENDFCRLTMLEDKLLIVADTAADQRFAAHPWVAGESQIRFFAGLPLTGAGGETVGLIGVFDKTVRGLTAEQETALRAFGRQAVKLCELRESSARLARVSGELEISRQNARQSAEYERLFRHANDAILIFEPGSETVLEVNDKACAVYGRKREDFIGRSMKEMTLDVSRGEIELEVLLHDGIYEEFESVHLRGDGTPINVVINGSVIEYRGRRAILSINRDVTARQTMADALREKDEHFRLLVEGIDNYAIFILDLEGCIVSWNAGAERLNGYKTQEIIGRHFSCFYTEADRNSRHPEKELAIALAEGRYEEEGWRLRKDGSRFLANVLITVLKDHHGRVQGFSKITHDVTARQQAETELRESRERYRQMFDSNPHPMWVYDLETLKVLAVNEEAVLRYGFTSDEFLGMTIKDLRPEEDIPQLIGQIKKNQSIEGPTASVNRHRKKNGDVIDVEIVSQPIDFDGRCARLVLPTDITERNRAEEMLRFNALHDTLTGLPNRALFLEHLRHAIERNGNRGLKRFSVLFLDIDHFKVINDSLGHLEGDHLLLLIAQRLIGSLRPGDIVARLGGDEFTILLDDLGDLGDVTDIAERIQINLKIPFRINGREVFTSASIGITHSGPQYTKPENMLRDADIAMYRAKGKGKARHEIFDQTMHDQVNSRLQLETELRQALDRDEFCLYYQPIVDLQNDRLRGFEALVRWRHPVRGLVSPLEFIPVAEEIGLIIPLGQWILRESCRQLREWQNLHPAGSGLTMSVNLSCRQFTQKDLVERVIETCEETRIEPETLRLEITESYLMEDSEASIAVMNRLRAAGIRLSIDDFGTGYSSLSYLHRLPVSYLKIDRSFVSRMQDNAENREIVRTIVLLAKNLNLDVIAEGIETSMQAGYLKSLDCRYGQGFLFSKPVEAREAAGLITRDFSSGISGLETNKLFELIDETMH